MDCMKQEMREWDRMRARGRALRFAAGWVALMVGLVWIGVVDPAWLAWGAGLPLVGLGSWEIARKTP